VPQLSFAVERAEATPFSAAPLLTFHLGIRNAVASEAVHAAVLRCQVRIDPTRRRYTPAEQEGLRDLFGEPARWGQTLRGMLWTHTNVMVPGFTGEVEVELPVPCTFDFNVAATRYFAALEDGEVALLLLFSGTVFFEGPAGEPRVEQVPWDREAHFRLPVRAWREMMDHYYPGSAWLCLRRDTFERLLHYKTACGLPSLEQALERLLGASGGQTP
jgi:hypothetical protein